ncbi:glutamate synthase subunit beta [soil metagenome]
MGKPTGFKEFAREMPTRRPIELRVLDWREVYLSFPPASLQQQGARCMDCGVPFCNSGCPLGNIIPDWNDLIYRGRWRDAIDMLHKTNNFPEFTGRICPAPCEEACVLGINESPVTIKNIELNIVEHAFANGWIQPRRPEMRTGKKVAVIGSGPAGLACAAQLNKAGHLVTVFERADRIGGLLTYGIPEFKLEKRIVDRRIALLSEEGINFVTGANVGSNVPIEDLRNDFDAIVLCGGATHARNLNVPGRDLRGIHLAMDYLPQANRAALGETVAEPIAAKDKSVVILGGGDTGADCLGTALRQGAKCVRQFELLPRPPESRGPGIAPWPNWPMILRTSAAHEEGEMRLANHRDWSISTKRFSGDDDRVKRLHGVRLEWTNDAATGRTSMVEVAGSEFEIDCDLCLLAMGFLGPEANANSPIRQLNLDLDARGNVVTDLNYMTSEPGVFSAGDMRRGQSLVVWAISEGRCAAAGVDTFLMGSTDLPKLKLF